MKTETKNLATYKEFGKMLREIANIYSRRGDEPLPTSDEEQNLEYSSIKKDVDSLTPTHCEGMFHTIRNWFALYPFDVDQAKKWKKYLELCEEQGIEPDYDNWENKL